MNQIRLGKWMIRQFLVLVLSLATVPVFALDISRPPETDDLLLQSQYGIWLIGHLLYKQVGKSLGSCEVLSVEGSVKNSTYHLQYTLFDHALDKTFIVKLDSDMEMLSSGRLLFPTQYKMKIRDEKSETVLVYRQLQIESLSYKSKNDLIKCATAKN